jgi:hypothetical protein
LDSSRTLTLRIREIRPYSIRSDTNGSTRAARRAGDDGICRGIVDTRLSRGLLDSSLPTALACWSRESCCRCRLLSVHFSCAQPSDWARIPLSEACAQTFSAGVIAWHSRFTGPQLQAFKAGFVKERPFRAAKLLQTEFALQPRWNRVPLQHNCCGCVPNRNTGPEGLFQMSSGTKP